MMRLKHIWIALFLVFGVLVAGCRTAPPAAGSVDLRVMSFNIRYGTANDGDNHWNHRKALVARVIDDYDADLVGLQEAYRFQLDYLARSLPQYSEIGEGRDGGRDGEYSAILYRTDRFDVNASGTFWLSDSPWMPSRHWGNTLNRICTWAHLTDLRTNESFYMFNTHFDHESQDARLKSAELIIQRIAEREHKDPVVLTGDFNAGEGNPAVGYLTGVPYGLPDSGAYPIPTIVLQDTFRVIHPDATDVGTGNFGYTGRRDGAKIDYVFATRDIEVLGAAIDQAPREGRYPSDHYPVTAVLRLTPARPDLTRCTSRPPRFQYPDALRPPRSR